MTDWNVYRGREKWILEFDGAKMSAETFALALEQARKNANHEWKKKGIAGKVSVFDAASKTWRVVSRYGY